MKASSVSLSLTTSYTITKKIEKKNNIIVTLLKPNQVKVQCSGKQNQVKSNKILIKLYC